MILLWRENNIQSISKQNEGGRRRNETPHPVVKKIPEKKAKGRIRLFFRPPFYPLGETTTVSYIQNGEDSFIVGWHAFFEQ